MSLTKGIKLMQSITFILLVIMAFEFIFGLTGTTVIIMGAAIRHIVFIAAFISSALLCILYMKAHKIALFSKCKSKTIFSYFSRLQWSVSVLLVSMLVSMTLIPFLRHNSLQLAKSEALDSFIMLALFLPISFLIRWKLFNYKLYSSILYALMIMFSVVHIVLYVGQSLNQSFIEMILGNLQQQLEAIPGVQSVFPQIILGHNGYPRVIFTTSIYLVYSVYTVLAGTVKNRLINGAAIAIHIAAILTTMTKSIWYGIVIGLVCYMIVMFIMAKSRGRFILKASLTILTLCVYLVLLNQYVFHNQVYLRFTNTFMLSTSSVNESAGNDTDLSESIQTETSIPAGNVSAETTQTQVNREDQAAQSNEQAAAVESNDIKIIQTKLLLKEWLKHPVLGNGFGSYIQSYIRSQEAVFSYEMQAPALLMKMGLLGVCLILLTVIMAFYNLFPNPHLLANVKAAWVYLILAFVMAVQTNPLLLSYPGISIFVIILELSEINGASKPASLLQQGKV